MLGQMTDFGSFSPAELFQLTAPVSGSKKKQQTTNPHDPLANEILKYLLQPESNNQDFRHGKLDLQIVKKPSTSNSPYNPLLIIHSTLGRTDHSYELPEFHIALNRREQREFRAKLSSRLQECIQSHLASERTVQPLSVSGDDRHRRLHEPVVAHTHV